MFTRHHVLYNAAAALAAPLPPEPEPEPAYQDGVLSLSPTAFWPMQEASGNLADASGNGWNATAAGSPTYQADGPTINGEAFKAITFNGSDSIFTASSSLTDPSTGGFTLSAWVKHPASTGRPVFYWVTTNQGTLRLSKGNSIGIEVVTINDANGVHGHAFHGSDLNDTWTWVGARYDTGGTPTLRAYMGAATADDTSFSGTWKRDGSPSPRIGGGGGAFWDGEIALLAYWNGPLSDADMAKLRTGEF